MRTALAIAILIVICVPVHAVAQSDRLSPPTGGQTAWNEGYPLKGLKNADALMASFKAKAKSLGKDEKLRILIIGDSLSDGYYHWSHHFRKDLQATYGDGGYGAIWATWAQEQQATRAWLWDPDKDFRAQLDGRWRRSWGSRGDIWPYLGWNGNFLATDLPDAEYRLNARGSTFTVVYSTGTFTTFDGQSIANRAAGFTIDFDGQSQTIAPAKENDPLDVGMTKFTVPDDRHTLKVHGVHDGTLSLHGVLVENSAPGIVVYNISHGGWWAHDYIWRQPGWEKILAEMQPDLTIIFLTKPESDGSGSVSDTRPNPEYEMLTTRVLRAVPNTQILFFKGWEARDGISPQDAQTIKDRTAWFESNRYPYLDLQLGLSSPKMKELGWFQDGIHLTPLGGERIGQPIARLFMP